MFGESEAFHFPEHSWWKSMEIPQSQKDLAPSLITDIVSFECVNSTEYE